MRLHRTLLGRIPACVFAVLLAATQALPAWSAMRPVPPRHESLVLPAKAARASVVLLRGGVGGTFSYGLDGIGTRLAASGVRATVTGYASQRAIGRRIIAERKRGGGGPVILIGHSFGANAATTMAADLARAGVPVDLLVSLAATAPRPVPPNVRRALNFYFSSGGWGRPLVAGKGFRGRLDNRDYARVAGIGHFNIEEQRSVQNEVVRAVLAAARP